MGMSSRNREKPKTINIAQILYYIQMGRLDATKEITLRDMYLAGAFHSAPYGVKILSRVKNSSS